MLSSVQNAINASSCRALRKHPACPTGKVRGVQGNWFKVIQVAKGSVVSSKSPSLMETSLVGPPRALLTGQDPRGDWI